MTTPRMTVLGLLVFALSAGGPAVAKPTPAQKCGAAKLKAAAKKAAAKLACNAKAASKGESVDDECLGKAEAVFAGAFAKAEKKGGCVTSGDAATVEGTVDGFVQSAVGALPAGSTQESGKCAGAKRKAAGKKASAVLNCHAKAVTKGAAVDEVCLGKADAALVKAFDKAEAKGGCSTVVDAATVEQLVDGLAAQVVPQLAPPATTTTTTPGTTTTTIQGVAVVTVGPGIQLIFQPATMTIKVGQTVRWEWATSIHSVVSGTVAANGVGMPDGLFCSPNDTNCLNPPLSNAGDVYEHTFNQAGTFPYFCSPHASSGMVGMVIVQP